MLFSAVACVLWAVTHVDFFRYVVLSMVGSAILNLNPFFRFDGYWLLTDLTGFVSLHRSAYEFWKFTYYRIVRKPQNGRRPDFLDRRSAIRAVFLSYAVASAVFLGYFAFQMGHAYLPYAFRTYTKDLPELIASAKHSSFNAAFWRLLFQIAMVSLSCWGLLRLVIDLGRKAVSGYKARASAIGGHQAIHHSELGPTGGA
jgi:putative peptide zinc metalloprotease protein